VAVLPARTTERESHKGYLIPEIVGRRLQGGLRDRVIPATGSVPRADDMGSRRGTWASTEHSRPQGRLGSGSRAESTLISNARFEVDQNHPSTDGLHDARDGTRMSRLGMRGQASADIAWAAPACRNVKGSAKSPRASDLKFLTAHWVRDTQSNGRLTLASPLEQEQSDSRPAR